MLCLGTKYARSARDWLEKEITLIEPLEQRNIHILGNDFIVVLAPNKELYMSITAICHALNVDMRSQLRRILQTEKLAADFCQLQVETRGGQQRVNSLALSSIPAWLSGIKFDDSQSYKKQRINLYIQELMRQLQENFPYVSQIPDYSQTVAAFSSSNSQCISGTLDTHEDYWYPVTARSMNNWFENKEWRGKASSTHFSDVTRPSNGMTPFLLVSHWKEDRAFRESCMARKQCWILAEIPYYDASNQVRIYLNHPKAHLDPIEAKQQIYELRMSTFLTSRIAFGLWYKCQENGQLLENGNVMIRAEEILEWRDIQKHSRAIVPGSTTRIWGNYPSKYLESIRRDFILLQQCHVYRQYYVIDNDVVQRVSTASPYMYTSTITEGQNSSKIIGFLVSPGEWYTSGEKLSSDELTIIDRRIFMLDGRRDSYAIRIAFFLAERWRNLARTVPQIPLREDPLQPYRRPIMMKDLLIASMIEIDRNNLTYRMVESVEVALQKLFGWKILGAEPECLSRFPLAGQWGRKWLSSLWYLVPNLEIVHEYQQQLSKYLDR